MEIRVRLCVRYSKKLSIQLDKIFEMIPQSSMDRDDGYFSFFEDFDCQDCSKWEQTINNISNIIDYFSEFITHPSFEVSVSVFSDEVRTEIELPINQLLSLSEKIKEVEFYIFSWGCQKSKGIKLIEENVNIRMSSYLRIYHNDSTHNEVLKRKLDEKIYYDNFDNTTLIWNQNDNNILFDFKGFDIIDVVKDEGYQYDYYIETISPWAECSFSMAIGTLKNMSKYISNLNIVFYTYGVVKR